MMITVKMYKLKYVYGQNIFKYSVKYALPLVCDTYLFLVYNGKKIYRLLIYSEYHNNEATEYGEWYPDRYHPSHKFFMGINKIRTILWNS